MAVDILSGVGLALHVLSFLVLFGIIVYHLGTGMNLSDDDVLEGDIRHGWILPDRLQGTTAVVGNGPLSDHDIQTINRDYDNVFVCNGVANREIRATYLVLRRWVFGYRGMMKSILKRGAGAFTGNPKTLEHVQNIITISPKFLSRVFDVHDKRVLRANVPSILANSKYDIDGKVYT